jgi:hypothetical protein
LADTVSGIGENESHAARAQHVRVSIARNARKSNLVWASSTPPGEQYRAAQGHGLESGTVHRAVAVDSSKVGMIRTDHKIGIALIVCP